MADEAANVAIGITANDHTAAGLKAAQDQLAKFEKRAKKASADVEKHRSLLEQKASASGKMSASQRIGSMASMSKGIMGHLAKVEQAAARALGGRSVTSGLASRMSAVGEAAESMGGGMAEAAAAGGGLAEAAGMVATGVGAVAAVAVAAGVAALSLATNWAKSATQIGNTASIIGVSTKALTEFAAAAERAGVDKGTATGAVGSLSQTLNDAKYGRNVGALSVLQRLGVGMKTNKDGTVDVEAMLPAIASAIARQNSSGRRTAASLLGIPEAALPVFMRGGKALSADMKDSEKTAAVVTDKDAADGGRLYRKGMQVAQLAEKGKMVASRGIALAGEGVLDNTLKASQDINKGAGFFKTTADAFNSSSKTFATAVDAFTLVTSPELWAAQHAVSAAQSSGTSSAIGGFFKGFFGMGSSGGSPKFSGSALQHAGDARDFFMSKSGGGWSKNAAAGFAAQLLAESGMNPQAIGDNGAAAGEGQWHADRQADFRQHFGKDIRYATEREQWSFVNWEARNSHRKAGNDMQLAQSPAAAGATGSAEYEAPKDTYGEMRRRAALADQIDKIPIHVTIEHVNAPAGTKANVKARGAISHAIAN